MNNIVKRLKVNKIYQKNLKINLYMLNKKFEKISQFCNEQFLNAIPKSVFDEDYNSLKEIEKLAKLRTKDRPYKVWKLTETSKETISNLGENQLNNFNKLLTLRFIFDLKIISEEIKSSSAPNLLSTLITFSYAFFPICGLILINLGAYQLLYSDYWNKIMEIVIFIAVLIL